MENIQKLFQDTIKLLDQMSIKYDYTKFQSGAIMLDIWYDDKFYVIQFEDYIGVSEVNDDNMGFDTIPDEKFYDEFEYRNKLNSILGGRIVNWDDDTDLIP